MFSETAWEVDIGYFTVSIGIKKYTRTSETPEDKPNVLPPQCHWKLGNKIQPVCWVRKTALVYLAHWVHGGISPPKMLTQ